MRQSTFLMDVTGEKIFEGFTSDEEWNGWACPYFTFEQAQKIVEAWRQNNWEAYYDQDNDVFVFGVNQDIDTGKSEEFDTFPPVNLEGVKVYPVGAFAWTWEEMEIGTIAEFGHMNS